jgi:hypothetical protein
MSFILLVEQAAPATPSANQAILYCKSDGRFYTKDDAGTEIALQAFVAATTRMLFQQTAAPTGWTKETTATYNDAALRFQTGSVTTGGADAFSTHFGTSKSTAGFTLTSGEIPASILTSIAGASFDLTTAAPNKAVIGGAGSHAHTLSNFDIKFADCIIATKD